MTVPYMKIVVVFVLMGFSLLHMPRTARAEKWIEFHAESWSHKSRKLDRKLNYSSQSYYDSDSINRTSAGDVTVWIKDMSRNDKYYVDRGVPEAEIVFKHVLLRCSSGKYEVILDDAIQDNVGEEIKDGSAYFKLYRNVCAEKKTGI